MLGALGSLMFLAEDGGILHALKCHSKISFTTSTIMRRLLDHILLPAFCYNPCVLDSMLQSAILQVNGVRVDTISLIAAV